MIVYTSKCQSKKTLKKAIIGVLTSSLGKWVLLLGKGAYLPKGLKNTSKTYRNFSCRMELKKYISLLLLLSFGFFGSAQKKSAPVEKKQNPKYKFSKKQASQDFSLNKARELMEQSPALAVKMLEDVISTATESKDKITEAQAYTMLGEVFEDIDQNKLAIQRYEQALQIYKTQKFSPVLAPISEKLAKLYLEDSNSERAKHYFSLCSQNAIDAALKLRCRQGIYDARILNKDTTGIISDLNTIMNENSNDSMVLLQNYARISQVNVQQNDISLARANFKRAVRSVPKEITIDEYKPVQSAMDDLLTYKDLSTIDKVDIRNSVNIESPKLEPIKEILVTENMKIAELYLNENKLTEAEKYIEVSKDYIDSETPAKTSASVFKKSAEIAQKKGKLDKAQLELDKYIELKELTIGELELELKKQIDILNAQQKIDISIKDKSISEKEGQLVQSQLRTQKIIIGMLTALLGASLIFFYFLYKNVKAKRVANQKLLLKSLRTQMNPHFIFNALNSVNNFIAKNDEKAANKFLSDFSKLMRKVLDYSQKDFITFEEEIELNELYLKLEHFRFRDKFNYEFENKIKDQSFDIEIPPMLIQPFIENAVWHGLRYKEEMGALKVLVNKENELLQVKIIDNGIGREKSKALKTKNQKKYKSTGLDNVVKRISLINELYNKNYKIEVSDADANSEDVGTIVKISIPIEN